MSHNLTGSPAVIPAPDTAWELVFCDVCVWTGRSSFPWPCFQVGQQLKHCTHGRWPLCTTCEP